MIWMTEEELSALCREWQGILRLQDWDVEVRLVPPTEIEGDRAHVVRHTPNKRFAVVKISDTAEVQDDTEPIDQEVSLVHELLHLHLWEMTDALASLAEELGALGSAAISMSQRQHDQAEERAVWTLAYALVGLKRCRPA